MYTQLEINWNLLPVEDIYFNGLGEPLPWEEDMASIEYIEQKLNELREKWKKEPANRKMIEVQAKLLQFALEKRGKSL